VVYDDAVPGDYDVFLDEPDALHAWAWRIVAPRDGLPRISLRAGEPAGSGVLPHSLDVLRFFLAGDASLPGVEGGGWSRHG
ncbi:MAG TPA: 3-oxoacyl-ACP synthase, partial [Thermomonas sp.]|nr:3-oxoacyl-ACP synthase [Thermomonas sp.]